MMMLRGMYHTNFIQYHDIYSWSENGENIIAVKMDWYDKTLADVIEDRKKDNKPFTDMEIM